MFKSLGSALLAVVVLGCNYTTHVWSPDASVDQQVEVDVDAGVCCPVEELPLGGCYSCLQSPGGSRRNGQCGAVCGGDRPIRVSGYRMDINGCREVITEVANTCPGAPVCCTVDELPIGSCHSSANTGGSPQNGLCAMAFDRVYVAGYRTDDNGCRELVVGEGNNCGDAVPIAENTLARCSDGLDNDANGFVDCQDFSCSRQEGGASPSTVLFCTGSEEEHSIVACSDGLDNDGNAFIDCTDRNCSAPDTAPAVTVEFCQSRSESTLPRCMDQTDNDGDGYVDCMDFDCARFGPPEVVAFCAGR